MILIGSRALAHYGLTRKCVDWDFIGSEKELERLKSIAKHVVDKKHSTILQIEDAIVEFTFKSPSDDLIYTFGSQNFNFHGFYYEIPDLEGCLAIKQATADHMNREKHFNDINWIYEKFPDVIMDQPLYEMRTKEIGERIAKSNQNKYNFFHQYQDVEKVEHDKLHDMIAEMFFEGFPAYQWFVKGDTTPDETAWNAMSEEMKLRRFVEETLVLTLERWFIPKLLKRGVHNPYTKKAFPKMTQTLGEHVIRGLRGEAPFLNKWGRENKQLILDSLKPYAERLTTQDFPKWFYDELLQMSLNVDKINKTKEKI